MRNINFENKDQAASGNYEQFGSLVISLRVNEHVRIDETIGMTLTHIDRSQVKILIQAPKAKKIERVGFIDPATKEVYTKKE